MKLEHPITVGTAEFNADQHAYYDWMRREAPVYRGRLALRPPEQDVYFISRYRDCQDLVTDPRIRRVLDGTADDVSVVPEAIRLLTTDTMVYQDDPSHLRLRKLVSRPFTPPCGSAAARPRPHGHPLVARRLAARSPHRPAPRFRPAGPDHRDQ